MIILTIAAALSTTLPIEDRQQVMGANSGDIYASEYLAASGDTRRISVRPPAQNWRSVKAKIVKSKDKRPVNDLYAIILKIKREHGITSKM